MFDLKKLLDSKTSNELLEALKKRKEPIRNDLQFLSNTRGSYVYFKSRPKFIGVGRDTMEALINLRDLYDILIESNKEK